MLPPNGGGPRRQPRLHDADGRVQTLVYIFYKGRWVLPVAGFAVGYLTNWVALKLIFEPARPWRFGCFTVQGLFLKRQYEASVELARASKEHFLAQDALWTEVFSGAWRDRWDALLESVTANHVRRRVNQNVQRRLAVALLLGEDRLRRVLREVCPLPPHSRAIPRPPAAGGLRPPGKGACR